MPVVDPVTTTVLLKRRLDAPDVTVSVEECRDAHVAAASEVVGERVGLLTAELEQKRTAATEESGALGHDAPEDLGAVAAAVVGEPRLEREGVTRQQC